MGAHSQQDFAGSFVWTAEEVAGSDDEARVYEGEVSIFTEDQRLGCPAAHVQEVVVVYRVAAGRVVEDGL